MKPEKQRIGIVFPWPNLDTVPCLCNTALALARHGYGVDIFTCRSAEFRQPEFPEGIEVLFRPDIVQWPPAGKGLFSAWRAGPAGSKSRLRYAYRALKARVLRGKSYLRNLGHAREVQNRHRSAPYGCFIGVDPEGLIIAGDFTARINVPVVYYSLELLLSEELVLPADKLRKQAEITLSRKAPLVVIQDAERGRLLAQDNGIAPEKFCYVPNAPPGPARRAPSGYWRRFFNLGPEIRIVLHSGSVFAWTRLEEIIALVENWPANWVLVVHTSRETAKSGGLKPLAAMASGRVFFSTSPVSREEYDQLVGGADIGLAFYHPDARSTYTGKNIGVVGLSSGKVAYYLRSGLPVIVNDLTSLAGFVRRNGCGEVVDGGREISAAIVRIAEKYDEYSRSALECFNRRLDFNRNVQDFLDRIDQIVYPNSRKDAS